MSQILIQAYLNDLDRVRKFSGSLTEGVISEAFKDLLGRVARVSVETVAITQAMAALKREP